MDQYQNVPTNKVKIVYVNPKFHHTNHVNVNQNLSMPSGGLHINPNFKGNSIFNTIMNDNLSGTINNYVNHPVIENHPAPKIHFNPRLFQVPPVITKDIPLNILTLNNHTNESKYVVRSKNKIVKTPAPVSQYVTNITEKSQILPTLIPKVVKKPSYSLVRNQISTESITNPVANTLRGNNLIKNKSTPLSKYSIQYKSKQLNDRVWKRKSDVALLIRNKYKISNNSRTLKLKSLTPHSKFKLCNISLSQKKPSPIKSKLFNTSVSDKRKSSNKSLCLYRTTNNLRSLSSKTRQEFVFIRGEKFAVSDQVLKRVQISPNKVDNTSPVKRIVLNGVIYVRKTNNTFIKDSRNIQSVGKCRKMNITCPIYRRLGKCTKHDKGKCIFVHDPKNIIICPKFLKGTCKIEDCRLSHQVVKEKMPTCRFFLEGCCVRDPCPYLHVKINESAKVCLQFLQGYCSNGVNCENLHIYVCPDFYRYSKCEKKKCLYPHKKLDLKVLVMPTNVPKSSVVVSKTNNKDLLVKKKTEENQNGSDGKSQRYFQEKPSNQTLPEANDSSEENNDNVLYKGRPKLGKLPSFISLCDR